MPEQPSKRTSALDADASDVVAIVVVRGDRDNPRTPTEKGLKALDSVLAQTALPGVILLVHVSHTAPAKLSFPHAEALIEQVHAPTAANLGQAIDAALGHPDVKAIPGVSRARWIWLLHDDMIAEPEALAWLLKTGRPSGSIAAIGPKQLDYDDPTRLLELGIRATGSSRRVEDIEVDEIDQGQYDSRQDVLAVGTAGMLVRKQVWDEVGGLDPALGPFGDGLEFGRRVRLAGHRVAVAPHARVLHEQAARTRERGGNDSFEDRRTAQIYNWCLSVSAISFPLLVLWLPILTVLRLVGRLLTRQPRLALAEVNAYLRLVGMSGSVMRGRRNIAALAKVPRSAVAELEANPADIGRARRMRKRVSGQERLSQTVLDQSALAALDQHRLKAGITLGVALLLVMVASIFIWRPYLSGIEGGLWGDLPTSWGMLLDQALSGWQISGDGAAGPATPVLVPFALLSAPFALIGIKPITFATLLPLFALPLAVCFGWLFASTLTHSIPIRLAGALLWAASPPLIISLVRGDLQVVLALLLLPVAATGLLRGLGPSIARRVRSVSEVVLVSRADRFAWLGIAGFATLFIGAVAPVMILVVLVVAILIATLGTSMASLARESLSPEIALVVDQSRSKVSTRFWGILVVVIPAIVLVLPSLAAHISSFNATEFVGWMVGGVSSGAELSTWWQFLAGYELSPAAFDNPEFAFGWSNVWMIFAASSGLFLLGWAVVSLAYALLHRGGIRWTPVCSFAGVVLFWSGAAQVTASSGGTYIAPILMAAGTLSLMSTAMTSSTPLIVSAPGLRRERSSDRGALVRGLIGGIPSLGAALTIAGLLVVGIIGPAQTGNQNGGSQLASFAISPSRGEAFPLIAKEAQEGERRARVLEISTNGPLLQLMLLRGSGAQIADIHGWTGIASSENNLAVLGSEESLAEAGAALVTGIRGDSATDLEKHAVDIVLLRSDSDHVADITNTIDATEGMERIGTVEAGTMWRVRPNQSVPARIKVQFLDGTAIEVASGPVRVNTSLQLDQSGTLVMAETRDPAWRATFDGVELKQVDSGDWRQAFEIPAGSGQLSIEYVTRYQPWWIGGVAFVTLVLLVSSIPLRARSAKRIPMATAQTKSNLEPMGELGPEDEIEATTDEAGGDE
ncbi:glycosyltransferase [Actinomycetaceae bacterium MB13-C1-2]|nr:glycosyltransferase [Actinomycetaceae bacterium MB13-C1-2]